ncbi:MAG: hypothetical protein ABI476_01255 [Oxalobacteraceae bacterium]
MRHERHQIAPAFFRGFLYQYPYLSQTMRCICFAGMLKPRLSLALAY